MRRIPLRDATGIRTPRPTRRAVLGALASMAWPSRLLLAQGGAGSPGAAVVTQASDVRLIPVEGEGARYWSRWALWGRRTSRTVTPRRRPQQTASASTSRDRK